MEFDFKQVNILTSDEVESLRFMYEKYPKKFWTRDFNLFNLYKCDIPRSLEPRDVDLIRGVTEKIKQHLEYKKDAAHYFLKYVTDSFTVIHADNPNRIKRTAVTLIDASPDLVGGDVILIRNITQEHLVDGDWRPDKNIENFKVPMIVRPSIGSTLIYNHSVRHGVTKVEQGHRLVFISWFS